MNAFDREQARFELWINTYVYTLPTMGEIMALKKADKALEHFDERFAEPIKDVETHQLKSVQPSPGKDGYNWNKQERRLYISIGDQLMVEKLVSLLPVNLSQSSIDKRECYIWDNGKLLFTIVYVS